MCGIGGIYVLDPDRGATATRPELEAMCRALLHRGPDELGLYRDWRCGLAHARLSIIDLSTGQQPLANEDRTVWVVFNGEIFNYVELRAELLALGHTFRTQSDTEVIVHAWEAWGEDAFRRFNGQFAIALWDARGHTLVLARDRLGKRPLYTCEHDGRLYFASEVKAIFGADRSIPRAFDPVGLDETFTFWSVVPPRAVFRGVRELEPGHVRVYREGAEPVDRAYWTPSYLETFRGSLEEASEAVRAAVEKATALRMLRADVPVGSYLSGGLDSSFVAALGLRAKGAGFKTFSLRFEDAEYDETKYQRMMSARLGTEHHEVVVGRADIAAAFRDVVRFAERPLLRTAPAPLFLLSRLVRSNGIKVVLTGEGADEMFAGYDIFREGKVRRFWAKHPDSKLRPRLLERLYPYLARSPVAQANMARQFFGKNLANASAPGATHATRWQTTSALKRLFTAATRDAAAPWGDAVERFLATLPAEFPRWSPLAQDQYIEKRTLLSGYLLSSQGDRMLMGNSVEGRFPFLDSDVMDLAGSLPAKYKLRALDEKHVLKRAAADLVPEEIRARPKQPYRAPDALSFVDPAGGLREWVAELTSDGAVRDAGVFEPAAVAQLFAKVAGKKDEAQLSNADNMAVVGVLSTQILHALFVKEWPDPFAGGPGPTVRTVIDTTET